jgi:tellurite resistance protein
MLSDDYEGWRRSVEDEFFEKHDKVLIAELKALKEMKETKESLRKASGIDNDAVLEKLVKLNVRPETVAALSFVPMVEVAWADGIVQPQEKTALLESAAQCNVNPGSPEYAIIERWLEHKPTPALLESWIHYCQGLCAQLSADERHNLRESVMDHARIIAQAHGGFLGLVGDKVSPEEKAMLARLDAAFGA